MLGGKPPSETRSELRRGNCAALRKAKATPLHRFERPSGTEAGIWAKNGRTDGDPLEDGLGWRLQNLREVDSCRLRRLAADGICSLAEVTPIEHYTVAADCSQVTGAIVCLLSALAGSGRGTTLV